MEPAHYPSPGNYDGMKGVLYECVRCHTKFDGEEFVMRGRIACPYCGYRVVKKVRPPIVKRIKCT